MSHVAHALTSFTPAPGLPVDDRGTIAPVAVMLPPPEAARAGAADADGHEAGERRLPRGLAVVAGDTTRTTRVFVCDPWNHRIQVLDGDGGLQFAFGGQGRREGQFDHPTDVAIVRPRFAGERGDADDGEMLLAVADAGNGRVQVFELDGSFVAAFGTPEPPAAGASGFTRDGWPFFRTGAHPHLPSPTTLAWRSPCLDVTCADGRIVRVDLAVAVLPEFERWRHDAAVTSLTAAHASLRLGAAADISPRVLAQIDTDLGRAWLARGLTAVVSRLWGRPFPAGLDDIVIERQLEERVHIVAVHGAAEAREHGAVSDDLLQLVHALHQRIGDARRLRARAVAVRELAWARVLSEAAHVPTIRKANSARAAVGDARGRLARVTHLANVAAVVARKPRTQGHIVWTAMPARGAMQQATTTKDRAAVVSADGRCLFVLDRLGMPVAEVPLPLAARPAAIAAHPSGGWLVADAGRDALVHVDASGTLLATWGTRGDGPRQFRGIAGLAITHDQVFICDRDHGRIQVRNLQGELAGSYVRLGAPVSVAVDGDTLLVAEWRRAQVRRLARAGGQPVGVFAHPDLVAPAQVVRAPGGAVLVTDRTTAAVFAFSHDGRWHGTLTAADGLLLGRPTGLAIVDRRHGLVFDEQHGRAIRFVLPAEERGWWLR